MSVEFQKASRGDKKTGFIGRFLRDRSGATAIEFTILAIPFSLLVFAILESCISFAGQQVMSNITDDVARQLRTGQIKIGPGLTEPILRDKICDQLEIMVAKDCPGLKIDLRSFGTFAEAAALRIDYNGPSGERTLAPSNFTFNPGPSMSKNVLRVFYEWPVITDFMRASMSSLQGGKTLHFATVTWQNEPFDD
ncbi:MAG: pilus assembly protein [Pseudaminobacter sp.]|nr:pilus assembly protein [Pseudaminobacter sp.]